MTKSDIQPMSTYASNHDPRPISKHSWAIILGSLIVFAIMLETLHALWTQLNAEASALIATILPAMMELILLGCAIYLAARQVLGHVQARQNELSRRYEECRLQSTQLHSQAQDAIRHAAMLRAAVDSHEQQTTQLREQLGNATNRLARWHQLGSLAGDPAFLDANLQQLIQLACNLTGAQTGSIELETNSGLRHLRGDDEPELPDVAELTAKTRMTEQFAVYSPFPTASFDPSKQQLLSVPLQFADEYFGRLHLGKFAPQDEFTDDDQQAAAVIATYAAFAISTQRTKAQFSQEPEAAQPLTNDLQAEQAGAAPVDTQPDSYLRSTATNLSDLLLQGKLTEAAMLHYIGQAARILMHYHAQSQAYILQPDTIVVDEARSQVALRQHLITQETAQFGSVFFEGFSAPEVRMRTPSSASDVYALGAYLFMFYFRRMPPSGAHLDLVLDHLNLSTAYVGMDYLLRKSLWHTPEHRLTDAAAFVGLLDAIQERARRLPIQADGLRLDIGAQLDVGLRKGRYQGPQNRDLEDRIFWDIDSSQQQYLLAIADGVSRANLGSGWEAAIITTDEAAQAWEQLTASQLMHTPPEAVLRRILGRANDKIVRQIARPLADWHASETPEPMAAAVCLALGQRNHVTIANLGDVHAYLVTPHFTARLTCAHTSVAESLNQESFTSYAALDQLSGSALSQHLGVPQRGAHGQIEAGEIKPALISQSLFPHESLVLASDGAYGYARDPQGLFEDSLHEILQSTANAQIAAFRLMSLANHRGGQDNISCIICRVLPDAHVQ